MHVSERDGRLWVQEIGGDGFVIYEFEVVDPVGADSANDVVTLLERLHELEERCKTLSTESSTPLELAVCRRNRKRARRRLQRWLAEHPSGVISAPAQFAYLVPTLAPLEDDAYEPDADELLDRFHSGEEIDRFWDYVHRMLRSPVVVAPEISVPLRALLEEAREAFCRGLFRATVAICRAVAEDALRRRYEELSVQGKVAPITADSIRCLAAALDKATLPDRLRGLAYRIAEAGNKALHASDATFDETDAWGVLVQTCVLVRYLSGGGYHVIRRC